MVPGNLTNQEIAVDSFEVVATCLKDSESGCRSCYSEFLTTCSKGCQCQEGTGIDVASVQTVVLENSCCRKTCVLDVLWMSFRFAS